MADEKGSPCGKLLATIILALLAATGLAGAGAGAGTSVACAEAGAGAGAVEKQLMAGVSCVELIPGA